MAESRDQRYWVYENGYLRGPFGVQDLAARDGFSISMMICRDGDHIWQRVHEVSEIAPALADIAHSEILASGDYIPDPPTPANGGLSIIEADSEESSRT